ncbi:hypothetical protein NGRA_0389 [Nosema granulosis]|uniref:Uncharacterized protein n=1 Tax=Nosema granulosis TaxID=83296 RepID=A0A9P6H344_9MICR|nr:hypothetical protein NGRA_0389 [Nosema granulosis]
MKIKQEFDIKLVEGTLDVYRLGKMRDLLQISEVQYKKDGKYTEINLKYPKNNISLLRSKTLNSEKITLASKGYNPMSQYFYLRLDKDKNIANIQKINTFYLFENKFPYLEAKQDKLKDGLQFRKIESREEIEHRKKNINYKIRNIENESFKSLRYVDKSKEVIEAFKYLNIEDFGLKKDVSVSKKIFNSIKNAVVVNMKDLEVLYKDLEAIRACLSKYTFYFNGRYILNKSFYSEDLQSTREKILEILHKKGYILESDVEKDVFLIKELCRCETPKYFLKGYHEDKDPKIDQYSSSVDSTVYDIIKERYFCTLADILKNCSLDADTVQKILFKPNITAVGEGIYTVYDPEDPHNDIKQEIVRLLEARKSYKKGEMNTAVTNISEVLKVDLETVQNYIEKVFVNKRGIWTVKESFE